MSTDAISIFLTGATGYVGGSVLQRLLQHPKRPDFQITALVRNAGKASLLETNFGVKTVVGSLQELEKLSKLVAGAHVIIHAADCDDVDAMKAILEGAKKRHEQTGDVPLLIHTSGTGEFVDNALGDYVSETIYSDLNVAQIEALPPSAPHRPVTLLAVEADTAGYVRTHAILPGFIYGIASGPLFDAGISNPHTVVTPLVIRAALQRGSLSVLGKGVSLWGNVHIDDTADLFFRLFDTLLSNPEKVSHGRHGYFFATSDECSMREVIQAVADSLFAMGRIRTAEVTSSTPEELAKYFGNEYLVRFIFTNSRSKAERARRELGWAPRSTKKDLLSGIKREVEIIVQKEDERKRSL